MDNKLKVWIAFLDLIDTLGEKGNLKRDIAKSHTGNTDVDEFVNEFAIQFERNLVEAQIEEIEEQMEGIMYHYLQLVLLRNELK